ncbi:hypothetical protein CEXT_711581 [Caerostris extrusa]|uniref:Secreted protein n=1 Tax=Caerostris extrusa TaxID=172846 RepID=A0AAV4N5C6_CAEEX|nr:hypothetical protein CEXT_711581 [Caerostris extrusa]
MARSDYSLSAMLITARDEMTESRVCVLALLLSASERSFPCATVDATTSRVLYPKRAVISLPAVPVSRNAAELWNVPALL